MSFSSEGYKQKEVKIIIIIGKPYFLSHGLPEKKLPDLSSIGPSDFHFV
jgi:hypothetical protein